MVILISSCFLLSKFNNEPETIYFSIPREGKVNSLSLIFCLIKRNMYIYIYVLKFNPQPHGGLKANALLFQQRQVPNLFIPNLQIKHLKCSENEIMK